jgi:hypothetical protein
MRRADDGKPAILRATFLDRVTALPKTAIGLPHDRGETTIATACRRLAGQPTQALDLGGLHSNK